MKNALKTLALSLCALAATGLSAQDKAVGEAFPELTRYAKMFDLTDEQVSKLEGVYEKTMEQQEALNEKSQQLQGERRERKGDYTEEEMKAWQTDMNETAKQRSQIQAERQQYLEKLLTEEQMEKYTTWKEGDAKKKSMERDMKKERLQKEEAKPGSVTPMKKG